MIALRILAFVAGGSIVGWVGISAIRSVVLPRGVPVLLTQAVFVDLRRVFDAVAKRLGTYERRDRLMALYPALGLIALPFVWVVLVMAAFTPMYWAVGVHWRRAFMESGSSLTTLGYIAPSNMGAHVLGVTEATMGLGLVALLISYLPSIYAAFQRRELKVALLEVRAGRPPWAVNWIVRHHRIGWLDAGGGMFAEWEEWFADIEETHTSLPALAYFRSPLPNRSWVTAAGAVLDAAALWDSTVDTPTTPESNIVIRAGFLSLRRIADYFGIDHDHTPAPTDPISIERSEFDAACDALTAAGVPVKADRDQAWRDFAGWRVNYDRVLIALATVVMAPLAPWSSDRSLPLRLRPRFSPLGVIRSVRAARQRNKEVAEGRAGTDE